MVTRRARASPSWAYAQAARVQFGGLGRRIIDRAFGRHVDEISPRRSSRLRSRALRAPRSNDFALHRRLGRGKIYSADVVRAVFPNFKEERRASPAIAARQGSRLDGLAQGRRSPPCVSACRSESGAEGCRFAGHQHPDLDLLQSRFRAQGRSGAEAST